MSSRRTSMSKRARTMAGATALSLGGFTIGGFGGFRPASAYGSGLSSRSFALPCDVTVSNDTDLQAAVANSHDDSVICISQSITLSAELTFNNTRVTLAGDDSSVTLTAAANQRHIGATGTRDDTLTILDLTFTGGNSAGDGGAIRTTSPHNVDIRIERSRFQGNSAAGDGGAIYAPTLFDSAVVIVNSDFTGNASPGPGAIQARNIWAEGSSFTTNQSTVSNAGAIYAHTVFTTDTDFTANQAASFGGAISAAADVTSNGGNFAGNTAGTSGGAIEASGLVSTTDTNFTNNTAIANFGGAIWASSVISSGGNLGNNTAGRSGGAIYATGPVTTTDTTFTSNTATANFGGAIYATGSVTTNAGSFAGNTADLRGGAIHAISTVSTTDTTFTSNTATDYGGGAIYATAGNVTTSGGIFSSNTTSENGGAIWASAGSVSISNTEFTANRAENTYLGAPTYPTGGAVRAGGDIHVSNASFSDNIVVADYGYGFGGALFTDDTVTVTNATFIGNVANGSQGSSGGAIYSTSGNVVATYTSFVRNRSYSDGGAIFVQVAPGSVSISNSTFYSNYAYNSGAGIFSSGPLTLAFVTAIDDSTPSQEVFHAIGSAPTITASVIAPSSGDACNVAADDSSLNSFVTDSSCGSGDDTINTAYGDRLALGFDDSITNDDSVLIPSSSSPLIGAAPFNLVAGVTLDQLGATRGPVTTTVGAVKVSSAPTPPTPPTPSNPPGPPRNPEAVARDRSAVVSWSAPASTGSFPITTYQVTNDIDGTTCLLTVTPDTPLTCTLTGLTNGTRYRFRVRALNGGGWGAWSDWTTPITPQPEPPTKTMVITGSRGTGNDSRTIRVTGTTTGLTGTVTPWIKFPGQTTYTEGSTRPAIENGTFTWQRKTGKKTYLYFTHSDGIRSNRLTIPAQR